MSSAGSQFVLLLWKNWRLQRRKICVTIFEIIVPLFFALLLLVIRARSNSTFVNTDTTFSPFYLGDLMTNGKSLLYYTPQNMFTDGIINNIKTEANISNAIAFSSEAAMISEWELNGNDMLWAGIVFTSDTTSATPAELKYKLRVAWRSGYAAEDRWRTDLTYPFFQAFGPRNKNGTGGEPYYHNTGFLTLQYLINKAFIKIKDPSSDIGASLNVSMQKMLYPPYLDDVLATVLQSNLPLFLVFSFILNTIQMAMNLTYEKEKKLKEAMKMMGLKTSMYWISWFVKNFIYLVLVIIAYTLIFSIKLGEKGKVINYTHMSLFFVFLLLYILATIAFAFMVSTFFSKANSAAFAAGILYFLTYFPYFFLTNNYETMSKAAKYFACLLHNQAMAFGIKSMLIYEGTGEGAQWNNFFKPGTIDDNFALIDAMVMLIVDTVLYMLIAWYVDNINPGDAGIAQPPWFPFKPSYWCGSKVRDSDVTVNPGMNINSKNFERDPPDAKMGISIRNLRKTFKEKVAVEDMSLNMFEGQITSLLGHNGAGKTTTISMLTGFMAPTSGSAIINGFDIRTEIEKVRQNLGLCPQHNILFDLLTVEEHLYFFAKLKGCDTKRANNEVREMIAVLGLDHKRNALSSTLSGGQKRKLSVGIALIAGSKVVVLDEPTSGMDPAARRQTWEILQKYREGRIIILTTHFMDEADILGDRIAIMADGVVKCCGTSMFLKKLYGAGYHMVIVKGQSCNVDNLTALVKSRIPSAQLKSQISAEVTYVLPFSESKKFEGLFKEIESKMKELGVNSFGVSATTMEEVFLKVGEGVSDEDSPTISPKLNGINNPSYQAETVKEAFSEKTKLPPVEQEMFTKPTSPSFSSLSGAKNGTAGVEYQNGYNRPPVDTVIQLKEPIVNYISYNEGIRRNTGATYAIQQFYGMLVKKFIHATRNITIALAQLLLPIIFTVLALSVEKAIPDVVDDPALVLSMSHFSDYTSAYSSGVYSNATTTSYANAYKSMFSGNTALVDRSTFSTMDAYFKNVQNDVGISTFNRRYIVAADFDYNGGTSSQVMATAHFNGQPFHGIAIALQYMMNGLLRKSAATSYIEVTNHPLPKKESDDVSRIFFATNGTAFTIAISILFGMAFMATSFIIFLIKERSVGAKHLQAVSGVRPFAYWLSAFIWDMFNYLIPVFVIMILFAIFGTNAYANDGRLGIVFFIFLMYGWSVLPFVYMWHFLFNIPSTGMVTVSMINLLSGLIFLLATYILSIPQLGTEAIGKALEVIFIIIFPNYNLGLALMDMYTNYGFQEICAPVRTTLCKAVFAGLSPATNPCCFPDHCGSSNDDTCFTYYDNYLQWEKPGIGREIIFMALQGFVYFAIVLLAEYGILSRIKNTLTQSKPASVGSQFSIRGQQEDSDVAAEANRINSTPLQELQKTDSLILKNVEKVYGTGLHAVKSVSCGIPKDECFGLLGQNGAGKTSTFKILTGDESLSSGSAYLNQYSVKSHIKKVQQNLGYCPQFDALIDQMTGRETLYMYARLRGIEESQIKGIVEQLINIMMLQKHADKETGFYSGGNKRKLSTAIALIGDPPFIFLDEPTTGMDPGARRQLWNVLSDVRASGRTLILTSHSMEECDALCTRLVIMVNGKFVCLGSPQHLKNKFGHGYTLFCRMGLKDGCVISSTDLVNHLKGIFRDLEVFESNQGYVHFRIPDDNAKLAQIFGVMEQAKDQFEVDDYSVHQTTLEQIFLTFTQNQVPPKEKDKKKCCKSCC